MSYVIYDTETTKLFRIMRNGYWQNASYKTLPAARAAYTRHGLEIITDHSWAIAEAQEFHDKIEKWETVVSILGGGEVRQRVNTPGCCDPSTELYWSM